MIDIVSVKDMCGECRYILTLLLLLGFTLNLKAQTNTQKKASIKTLTILNSVFDGVESKQNNSQNYDIELEIDGLIIDETISKIGRDFFELFYSNWKPPKNATNYTIRINEKISPGMATQIAFYINDKELFKQKVQPRYDYLEMLAGYINRLAYSYLANYNALMKQLENEDQQGTGLY